MDTNKELLKIQRDQKVINNYFALFEELRNAPNIEEEVKIIDKIEKKLEAAIVSNKIVNRCIDKLIKIEAPNIITDVAIAEKVKEIINRRGLACTISSAEGIIGRYRKSSRLVEDLRSSIRNYIGISGNRLIGIVSDLKPILDSYFDTSNTIHGYVIGIPAYPVAAEYFSDWQVTHLVNNKGNAIRCTVIDREQFITAVVNRNINIGRMISGSKAITTGETVTWEESSRTHIIEEILLTDNNLGKYSLLVREEEKARGCSIPYMQSGGHFVPLNKLI